MMAAPHAGYYIFHVWSLSSSANGDITHNDNWNIERVLTQNLPVKHFIAHIDSGTVQF
jgi:hypothetical protein